MVRAHWRLGVGIVAAMLLVSAGAWVARASGYSFGATQQSGHGYYYGVYRFSDNGWGSTVAVPEVHFATYEAAEQDVKRAYPGDKYLIVEADSSQQASQLLVAKLRDLPNPNPRSPLPPSNSPNDPLPAPPQPKPAGR